MLLHPGLNFLPTIKQRSFIYRRASQQCDIFHRKIIWSGTLIAHLLLSEAILAFFSDSTCFHPSQRHPDFDGMQCLRHPISVGLISTRGAICLHHKERFSSLAHIPSLQFVTRLPDFSKGWAKGHVLVSSLWNGLTEGLNRLFKPT